VCIRKQLIATCSRDKTINIWNVKDRCLEIEPLQPTNEECTALAFHPSGLHLLVALSDKINAYNLRADKLHKYKEWPIKFCTDIKFSHGGHLFAAACENKEVKIFNFYTSECPENMCFDAQKVCSIDWYENDMGFSTCGVDGNIYFFDLFVHT
jgi:WD40 repeat protein